MIITKQTKRIIILIITVLTIVSTVLFALQKDKNEDNIQLSHRTLDTDSFESQVNIAVITDVHFGAGSSISNKSEINYREEIIDALTTDIRQKSADILVLCGDNSNSSKREEHENLSEKLYDIEKSGIQVLVVVGNHDIGTATADDFVSVYKDFGYGEAFSRDSESLSYSYVYNDRILLLLLDTNGYTDYNNGNISSQTNLWIEEQLIYAKENNLKVIAFGHLPLVTDNRIPVNGGDETIELFLEYDVPLYVCGHMHNRNVNTSGQLTELVVEQTSVYPFGYANISLDENNDILYAPEKINVAKWADSNGINDERLINIDYLGSLARNNRCAEIVEILNEDKQLSKKDIKECEEFYTLMTVCYQEGSIFSNRGMLMSHEGYNIFKNLAKDTNYERWFESMFENSNVYTEGFIIRDGVIG